MGVTSLARDRREKEGWPRKYLVGQGVDVGPGTDPITDTCIPWDMSEGHYAEELHLHFPPSSLDWVYSSHCLEHLKDPERVVRDWWGIIRPGGYLLLAVPDEDMYEQGWWPSKVNAEHTCTWTIHKDQSWSPVSRNLRDLLESLPGGEILSLRRIEDNFQLSMQGAVAEIVLTGKKIGELRFDQTQSPFDAECSIEAVVRKQG